MLPNLIAVLTDQTCGEACWTAQEDVCHCSCGGKNHGIMRTPDGVRPIRMAKIQGTRYSLGAVGTLADLCGAAEALNKTAGIVYRYAAQSSDRMFDGLPAKIRPATKDQIERWPELATQRERLKGIPSYHWWRERPYLLWIREDPHA